MHHTSSCLLILASIAYAFWQLVKADPANGSHRAGRPSSLLDPEKITSQTKGNGTGSQFSCSADHADVLQTCATVECG
jgi:hypothetical protein